MKSTFEHFDKEKIPSVTIAVFCLFFVVSCGLITRTFSSADSGSNTNSNTDTLNANGTTTTSYDGEKFQKLLDKGHEIEKISFTVKLDPQPKLNGKVYVFNNTEAKSVYRYDDGISFYRKANNLEELQTVIRINCRKGKYIGDFQKNDNGYITRAKGFGNECEVSLIDYPSGIIFDRKTFSNNEKRDIISQRDVKGEIYLNPPPVGDISRYINSLPVNEIAPNMTSLDENELIRLPTTVSLNSDAAIKGKIAFARKFEKGDAGQSPVEIDGYAINDFPFDKRAVKPEEIETLVKITCGKGDKIGQKGEAVQYSNRCEVSLIDYKTLTVFAQKTIENKNLDNTPAAKDSKAKIWITDLPEAEIANYLKNLPAS